MGRLSVLTAAESPLDLPPGVLFGGCVPLVVQLLAPAQAHLQLHASVLQIDVYKRQLPYFETFGSWSIEEKAAFSKEWYSYMKEYKKIHPGYRGMYYYETCHAYGLPTDQDIGQDRAEKISRDALKRYGVSDDYINRASTHFYFDISNPEHELWKVYLSTLFRCV